VEGADDEFAVCTGLSVCGIVWADWLFLEITGAGDWLPDVAAAEFPFVPAPPPD
jgi:hypothetical protein